MKKKLIFIALVVVMALATLVGCGSGSDDNNKDTDYVKYNDNTKCVVYVVNNAHEGSMTGSYIERVLSCVLEEQDKILHVYLTRYDTTGDNGATVLYNISLDDETYTKIHKYCDKQSKINKNNLYSLTYKLVENMRPDKVLTKGMNDEESMNEDGSYKWRAEFEAYYK